MKAKPLVCKECGRDSVSALGSVLESGRGQKKERKFYCRPCAIKIRGSW